MKSKRLFIIAAAFLLGILSVGGAGMSAQAAKAEKSGQRVYTDTELGCMAKYYYMRTGAGKVYPAAAVVEEQKDGTWQISLWEKGPVAGQDSGSDCDARYHVDGYGKGTDAGSGSKIDLTVYSKVYTAAELCKLAQNYYYENNDFYPPDADAKDNGDGTFTIRLYESIRDDGGTTHTATCGWYTVDVCGMGKDDLTDARVDINP